MEQTMLEIASSGSTISHQSKENEIKKRPYPDSISSGYQESSETVQAVQETMLSHESPKKKRCNCNSSDETNSFPADIALCKEARIDGDSPHSAVSDTDTTADGSSSILIEESMQVCQTGKIEIGGNELNQQLVSKEDDQKPRAKVSCSSPGSLPNSSVISTLTSSTDSSPISGSAKITEGTNVGQDLPVDGHPVNLLKESECFGYGSKINNVTDAVPALISAETSQSTALIGGSELNRQLVSEGDDQTPRAKVLCSSPGIFPNSSVMSTVMSSTDSSPISGSAKITEATTTGQDLPKDGHSVNLLKESECLGNGSTINNVTDAVPALISAETSQSTACCQEDKTSGCLSLLNQSFVCSEQRNVKADEHCRRKLLILDVNGLLADILPDPEPGYIVDTWLARKAVFKRTFCSDFLQFCFDNFNVGIWSSRNRRNVESIVNFLMGEKKNKLLFCWNQAHCTNTGHGTARDRSKPLFLKEIKKLWDKEDPDLPWEKGDYDESNTLLMDDSPHKALRNPLYTGIFPQPYLYKDNTDTLLGPKGELRLYLQRLVKADHVQKFVAANPYGQKAITKRDAYWPYYSKILNSMSSSGTEKKGNEDRLDEPKTDINDAKQEAGEKGDADRSDELKIDIKQEAPCEASTSELKIDVKQEPPCEDSVLKIDVKQEPPCEASTCDVAMAEHLVGSPN